jgi:hypothetical protein
VALLLLVVPSVVYKLLIKFTDIYLVYNHTPKYMTVLTDIKLYSHNISRATLNDGSKI